jgi:beta-glucosidase
MEPTDLLYLPPSTETTELGWEIYAPGFHRVLMDLSHRYKVPIYVTENGIADGTDTKHPRYILTHLAQMHRAIRDGADIRGYFHWTFIDNFEWLEGWRPKFGLLAMDPVTRDRIPRRSAALYSEIARANAIPADV